MRIEANGIGFVCQIDGPTNAPWLTFSNSLNTNYTLWDTQVSVLSDRYRILRYNTRGHDGTDAPPGPWNLEDLASDIVGLWDALGIERSHFVGLSIGGMTGQALALGWPERINAYALADTRADFTGEFAATVPALIDRVAREGLDPLIKGMPLRWFTEDVRANRPELVDQARALIAANTVEGYIACADAMTRLDFMDRLHEIELRTLLICGAQDLGTPPDGMREMHARMPNATYVEIDPAGHLSNLENPAAFNAALVPFLESFNQGDQDGAGAGAGETVFAGFDFPLGLPEAYAVKANINHFIPALARFGRGHWADFYTPAIKPDEISIRRPFYPDKPGGTRHKQLTDGLGVAGIDDLRRVCDHPTDLRFAASPLFWTLGGQQVGKAAISGWRDLITPAMRARSDLHIWPFDGNLGVLLDRPGVIVAETYPGEVYSHLQLRIGAPNKSKRNQADRRDDAEPLLKWAADNAVELSAALAADIRDGFGPGADGEDRFDATVGLFGMLNVVYGHRPPGDPRDRIQRDIEGWILGLDPDRLRPRGA